MPRDTHVDRRNSSSFTSTNRSFKIKAKPKLNQARTKPAVGHNILEDKHQVLSPDDLRKQYHELEKRNPLHESHSKTLREQHRSIDSSGGEGGKAEGTIQTVVEYSKCEDISHAGSVVIQDASSLPHGARPAIE